MKERTPHWRDLWDRPSIDLKARPDKPPRRMTRNDLIMPRGPYSLKTAGLTLAGGVGMAVLYVFFPLLLVSVFAPIGPWILVAAGIAAVVFWIVLFVAAVREHAADERFLKSF